MPSLKQLKDLLDPKLSFSLVNMSRLQSENHSRNGEWMIMLKWKLRLEELWHDTKGIRCFGGYVMDIFGNHVLSCKLSALSNYYVNCAKC